MKKIISFVLILILLVFAAGCKGPEETPSGSADPTAESTPTPAPTSMINPQRTLSPLLTPTPVPEETPAPTPTPGFSEFSIFTLDQGTGTYAYAWTKECPVTSDSIPSGTRSAEVSAIQNRLNNFGFYFGTASGVLNNATMTAVNEFRKMNGLEAETSISRETIDLLFSSEGIKAMTIEELAIEPGSLDGLTVFVDAGHGASATGTAKNSLVEKDCVIEIAYRLKSILEAAGARVIMTRKDDSDISLTYRSALTNVTMLNDLIAQDRNNILTIREKTQTIKAYADYTLEELSAEIKELNERTNRLYSEYIQAKANLDEALAGYGSNSDEYRAAERKVSELKEEGSRINEKKTSISQIYYYLEMGVELDTFISEYENQVIETEKDIELLEYYVSLFEPCLESPSTENAGIYHRILDDNGIKIIDQELSAVLDLTNERCTGKYVFISVHVNGVDNADYVNGTEIYTRSVNKYNTAYGINRSYYYNYCATERNALAEALQEASMSVDPLSTGKAAKVKDSDLFVLREINIPCILLETGYVTNEYDRVTLMNPATKYKFAYMIYEGLNSFYNK